MNDLLSIWLSQLFQLAQSTVSHSLYREEESLDVCLTGGIRIRLSFTDVFWIRTLLITVGNNSSILLTKTIVLLMSICIFVFAVPISPLPLLSSSVSIDTSSSLCAPLSLVTSPAVYDGNVTKANGVDFRFLSTPLRGPPLLTLNFLPIVLGKFNFLCVDLCMCWCWCFGWGGCWWIWV